ncbi:MAG: NYN domain-containing protein [Chloroflexi bacterium]|nr:NYN domain-containing protein [Chloroflexota bacterium]
MRIISGDSRFLPCYIYVDAGYVREELKNHCLSDEFSPRKIARALEHLDIFEGKTLKASRLFYYDAQDSEAEESERNRIADYFAKIQRLPDTHVTLGEIRKGKRRREQKGVDVQIAVDALKAATSGVIPVIVLVTGDADFAPLAKAIREAGPHVLVVGFSGSLSDSLIGEADRVYKWETVPSNWNL